MSKTPIQDCTRMGPRDPPASASGPSSGTAHCARSTCKFEFQFHYFYMHVGVWKTFHVTWPSGVTSAGVAVEKPSSESWLGWTRMLCPTKLWEVFEHLIKKTIHYIFSPLCSKEHQVRDPDVTRLQNLDSLVCLESQPHVLPHKVQCNPEISLVNNQLNLDFVLKLLSSPCLQCRPSLLQTVLRSEGGPTFFGDCVAFAAASYVRRKETFLRITNNAVQTREIPHLTLQGHRRSDHHQQSQEQNLLHLPSSAQTGTCKLTFFMWGKLWCCSLFLGATVKIEQRPFSLPTS